MIDLSLNDCRDGLEIGGKWRLKLGVRSFAFFPLKPCILIEIADIELLKLTCNLLKSNGRLCLHSSEGSRSHQMIVCEMAGMFYPPHIHQEDSECFCVIEGELCVLEYDSSGVVSSCVKLNKGQFFKAPLSRAHSVYPVTPFVVYFESKAGPYLPLAELAPSWAPCSTQQEMEFMEMVRQKVSEV